jgi:hypothetical protein
MAIPKRRIAQTRTLRKEKSFLDLHPFDAYHYVLHLLGKRDDEQEFPTDITILLYIGREQGRLPIEKASVLVEFLAGRLDKAGGSRPGPKATRSDIVCQTNGELAFPDFLYAAAFGEDGPLAVATLDSVFTVARTELFLEQARIVLARHAYAAIQMLCQPGPSRTSVDNWVLEATKPARSRKPVTECELQPV